MRRVALAAAAAAALVLLPACNNGSSGGANNNGPPPGAALVVDIKNIAFNPKSVTIRSGQTVAWKFDDGAIFHNVVGDTWRSPDTISGYFTHTFDGPGTYSYRCTIHTGMTGDVFVTP